MMRIHQNLAPYKEDKMWRPKITKDEFESKYIQRSKITRVFYNEDYITLPCDCGEKDCEGWASISKEPENVCDHIKFYSPHINEYLEYKLGIKKPPLPEDRGLHQL